VGPPDAGQEPDDRLPGGPAEAPWTAGVSSHWPDEHVACCMLLHIVLWYCTWAGKWVMLGGVVGQTCSNQ